MIEFSGFGVDASNNATGENITDLGNSTSIAHNTWEKQIKENTDLLNNIAAMMNSLGYDKELDEAYSPRVGVQNQ